MSFKKSTKKIYPREENRETKGCELGTQEQGGSYNIYPFAEKFGVIHVLINIPLSAPSSLSYYILYIPLPLHSLIHPLKTYQKKKRGTLKSAYIPQPPLHKKGVNIFPLPFPRMTRSWLGRARQFHRQKNV